MKIIPKYQKGKSFTWQQVMQNVDENHIPHFLQPYDRTQAQLSPVSQEEINRQKRDKQQREAEQRRAEQLSKSQHMWNWTGPLMNTSSTNRYNAQSRFDFNKEATKGATIAGLTTAVTPALLPGGAFWTKGIQWLNPSRYLGKGSYTTALGGQNASAFGALADNALVSYGAAEALQHFRKNPNFRNGTSAVLAGVPLLARPTLTANQFVYSFNLGRYKDFEDLLKYNISKENAQKLFDIASSMKKKIGKFSPENLKDKNDRALYDAILSNTENNMFRKKGAQTAINTAIQEKKANTPEGLYDNLLNSKNAQILNENAERLKRDYGSEINLNLFNGSMLAEDNIPRRVAVAKVDIPSINGNPAIKDIPIMERFYQNAVDKLLPLQNYLIKNKYLIPTERGWYGRQSLKEEPYPVNPEKFILSMYDPIKNSTNRVDFRRIVSPTNGQWIDRTAWHGTPVGDKSFLEQFRTTLDSPFFNTISDGMPGVEGVRRGYQGTGGTSIPVLFKNKEFELRPIEPMEGFNSSLGYIDREGNTLGQLKNHFSTDVRGKAAEVRRVSDAAYDKKGNTGQVQNEYIFGGGTPDVKFFFNTLDFLRGYPPYLKKGGNIVNNKFNRINKKDERHSW